MLQWMTRTDVCIKLSFARIGVEFYGQKKSDLSLISTKKIYGTALCHIRQAALHSAANLIGIS